VEAAAFETNKSSRHSTGRKTDDIQELLIDRSSFVSKGLDA
jgi:hypothetical protein